MYKKESFSPLLLVQTYWVVQRQRGSGRDLQWQHGQRITRTVVPRRLFSIYYSLLYSLYNMFLFSSLLIAPEIHSRAPDLGVYLFLSFRGRGLVISPDRRQIRTNRMMSSIIFSICSSFEMVWVNFFDEWDWRSVSSNSRKVILICFVFLLSLPIETLGKSPA